jgi:ribosomal protein L35AE/L33A
MTVLMAHTTMPRSPRKHAANSTKLFAKFDSCENRRKASRLCTRRILVAERHDRGKNVGRFFSGDIYRINGQEQTATVREGNQLRIP